LQVPGAEEIVAQINALRETVTFDVVVYVTTLTP
jgi:hypothetical protein